jgi:hypothetical protein
MFQLYSGREQAQHYIYKLCINNVEIGQPGQRVLYVPEKVWSLG